jgi:NAD+ diphosphatase
MTTCDDRLPLSRATYDRAGLRREDADWLAAAWERARVLLLDQKSRARVTADGGIDFCAAAEAPAGVRRFLGLADDVPYFSVTVAESDHDDWQNLRQYGPRADDLAAGLAVCAVALEEWHRRHTHCPLCGTPTAESRAGWTRTCPKDGSDHFPRTDPAVIMLIHDGGDLALLGRGHQWGPGRFSTLAGFVEPGESLEAAVAREVFEETGVGVRDVRYVGSQPWPFPASLMVGFVAQLDGDPSITLDPVEMAEAAWFTREDIRQAADWTDELDTEKDPEHKLLGIPPRFSISRYLIDEWLAARIG